MALVGVSAGSGTPKELLADADFIEIKKITPEEARSVREVFNRPIFYHLQYTRTGDYLLPTALPLQPFGSDFLAARDLAPPVQVSLHFGLAAGRIAMDSETYMAVALDPPLSAETLLSTLEGNLRFLRSCFPECPVLLENVEFIPEAFCGGAYRHVGDARFFSKHVTEWHERGLVDGIVFDIAHGLIASGNHSASNGERLPDLFEGYLDRMPLTLVREIHLSGITRISRGIWADAHNEIGELELGALRALLTREELLGKHSIPVTLEYVRDWRKIAPQIGRIRDLAQAL
jgi:hypothetical protein